jgi:hypothetical protein
MFPPTNVNVDFAVKERMGEFYAALHDIILEKNPKTFLAEYAWPAESCGHPCPTEPVLIHELLSLGADVFERDVPEAERNPKPPELTKEEKEARKAELKELKPKERKEREKMLEEERRTVLARKGLLERNKYILSRLHYRYNQNTLSEDLELGPANPVEGGIDLPKGPKGVASTEIKPAKDSKLQIRFNFLEPNIKAVTCEKPERWRWGKRPREVMRLRKTWVADDLTRKSRTQIKPEQVILSPVPALGITGAPVSDAKAETKTEKPVEKEGCGCRLVDARSPHTPVSLLLLALSGAAATLRRKRRR